MLLEAGQQIDLLPAQHELRRQVTQNLTSLYEAWHRLTPSAGQDAQADKWRAKLTQAKAGNPFP